MNPLDIPIWRLAEAADAAAEQADREARDADIPVAGLVKEKRLSLFVRKRLKMSNAPRRLTHGSQFRVYGKRPKHGRA